MNSHWSRFWKRCVKLLVRHLCSTLDYLLPFSSSHYRVYPFPPPPSPSFHSPRSFSFILSPFSHFRCGKCRSVIRPTHVVSFVLFIITWHLLTWTKQHYNPQSPNHLQPYCSHLYCLQHRMSDNVRAKCYYSTENTFNIRNMSCHSGASALLREKKTFGNNVQ